MEDVYIYGAGGAGREIIMIIEDINNISPKYNIKGFIDDNDSLLNKKINNIPVVGNIDFILNSKEKLNIVMGIADPNIKEKIVNKLNNKNINWITLIHPSVYIYDNVKISRGSVICMNSILSIDTQINEFVYINFNCTIPHDTTIGKFSSLMNNVVLSGNDKVKEKVFIGSNAVIIQNLHIGKNSVVGAGSVVIRDIEENTVVAGNPAKIINRR